MYKLCVSEKIEAMGAKIFLPLYSIRQYNIHIYALIDGLMVIKIFQYCSVANMNEI